MQPLDKQMQRRVWARVYDRKAAPLSPQQRQSLQRCLVRIRENLAVYEKMEGHSIYAEAFARLHAETAEQIKMLKQMLR